MSGETARPAKQWVPLESNPQVLTEFSRALGVPAPIGFSDVFSTELLEMVPRPSLAVLLLFPLTPALSDLSGPTSDNAQQSQPYFMRQIVSNACGTIALIHAIANCADTVPLEPGKFFASFLEATKDKDPMQRAGALAEDDALDATHAEFARRGQTQAPSVDERIDLHFVALVHHDGKVWELDGRKDGPVMHAECTPETLLEVSCDVIKEKFMAKDPSELRFTILSLGPVE
mmetsp:Transcript_24293/g.59210  ORF Transcript_24293/g.59210 Transcript_24293/m.59210 type:complete len:231 (+) Transcript_24293:60-752(+)